MPTRVLPKSPVTLIKAMMIGKEHKDVVPTPPETPYTAATAAWLDLFYPAFKLKVEARDAALIAQGTASGTVRTNRQQAEYFINDFYSALQSAIRRGTFNEAIRPGYGLDISDGRIPVLKSEADILYWGDKAAVGEATRVTGGGVPIGFPTIAQVTAAYNNFKNQNLSQSTAKYNYDIAQEAVAADMPEAERLVLKMWNETEAAFDTGDKPSMRRKCREWGMVFVPNAGEAPSPDDFSIMGKVTNTANGNPINEAVVYVQETNETFITDSQGNYFVSLLDPGTYTLHVIKNGFDPEDINGVVVTAGAIATLNVQLGIATTGRVTGTVAQGGTNPPATVTVAGFNVTPSGDGGYEITNVPPGPQTVQAWLNSAPGNIQTQNITVTVGGTVTVDFDF